MTPRLSKICDVYLHYWLLKQVLSKNSDNKIVMKVLDHNKQLLGYVLDHSWNLSIARSATIYPIYTDIDYMVQILNFYIKINHHYPDIRKLFRSNPLTYIGFNVVTNGKITNIEKITHIVNIDMDDMLNPYQIFRIDGKLIAEGNYQY